MMVVSLAQARASGKPTGATPATEATVEGPFYWPGAPDLPLGSDIGEGVPGEPTLYMGRVTDCDGKPLAGALLDVWSGDGDGKYDVQLAAEPTMKARGRFRTDAEGRYWFWSIRPNYYPVPGRRPGRRDDASHRPQHLPPGPHPHDGLGRRPRAGHDPHLRRRQSLHRSGRGVRQARQPGGRLRRPSARQGGRRPAT
jgi:hydroxyquinol 1,2-dioxygenase